MDTRTIIAKLGGPAAVARALGIRCQAVSLWSRKGRIPLERVPALERRALEIGVDVRAEHMRPDVDWSTLRQRGWTALRA
jgi:DNA-binding transcriptional regulator YdaS (Cro superfamily)